MKKNTKEIILITARNLFAQVGFDGCSVDSIAAKAGVNKALIYYYYENKASLYEKIFEANFEDFLKNIRLEIARHKTPKRKLRAYIDTFSKNFRNNHTMAPLMLRELASDGKNLSANSREAIGNIIQELDYILKEGVAIGTFKETKTLLLHTMIVGCLNIFISTKKMRKAFKTSDPSLGFSLSPNEAATEIASVVMNGITND